MHTQLVVKTHPIVMGARALRLSLHLATGSALAAFFAPFCSLPRKKTLIQWWCAKLVTILNIKVSISGDGDTPSSSASTLFVANHISWVDIFALMSHVPLRFIAKSDIEDWPVLGFLAKQGNVIFIERGKRQEAKRMNAVLREFLQLGENLCYFPEGTTTDGTTMLPFKGSLLQAAMDVEATIQPVAIFYPLHNREANIAMSYSGETTMTESLKNILSQRAPIVELHFFSPLRTDSVAEAQDRRKVSEHIYTQIETHLFGARSPTDI